MIPVLGRACAVGLGRVLPRGGARALPAGIMAGVFAAPALGGAPDPGEAMAVYRAVDSWVRAWEVRPGGDGGGDAGGPALSSVTIRLDGRVLGRGAAVREDLKNDAAVWGTTHAEAARRAIARARAALRGRAGEEEPEWDALALRVTLSVEVGGAPTPVSARVMRRPMLGLSPGVHAMVARLGGSRAVMTPDQQITLGLEGRGALGSMAAELADEPGLSLASVDALLDRGVTLARARTVWVAQPRPGLGGVFLDRGGRVVDADAFGTGALASMRGALVRNLENQAWPGAERYGMAGRRDAISGASDPTIATALGQGLSVIALSRYARAHEDREVLAYAVSLMHDLARVEAGEPEPWAAPAGAAACVLALDAIERAGAPMTPELSELETRCADAVVGAFTPRGGFAGGVPSSARGLIAWALVRLGDGDAALAVRRAYADTAASALVTQMPFLGWAELELAGDGPIEAREALVGMRELMWSHQIGRTDVEPWDRDLRGAIVFTGAENPAPTSRNLRPLAFACTMLGDARLTPGAIGRPAVSAEIGRLADALRFARQLMFDDSSAFLSALPGPCIGGVRRSLWDWTIAPADTAMALLCVLEFERSLGAVAGRDAAPMEASGESP